MIAHQCQITLEPCLPGYPGNPGTPSLPCREIRIIRGEEEINRRNIKKGKVHENHVIKIFYDILLTMHVAIQQDISKLINLSSSFVS